MLTSNNYLTFLAGWEIMTIPSYVIIGLNRKIDYPAFTLISFSELSTILLLSSFLYTYNLSHSLYFLRLSSFIPLIISSLGFMVKMGVAPFLASEWLPIAHGNSPANLSAIMSRSMTLMGIYGIVKITLLSLSFSPLGYFLMMIGGFSVFLEALYSYTSNHVKGLPAFSTIENNGAIFSLYWSLYDFSSYKYFRIIYSHCLCLSSFNSKDRLISNFRQCRRRRLRLSGCQKE